MVVNHKIEFFPRTGQNLGLSELCFEVKRIRILVRTDGSKALLAHFCVSCRKFSQPWIWELSYC